MPKGIRSNHKPVVPLLERFMAKVERIPIAGCWIWTAATKEFGYGVIGLGPRSNGIEKAHRTSWKLFRGDIPSGMNVLHRCGVASCVNPDHLYIGTLKDNSRDTFLMGRAKFPDNRGERAKWAKLTSADVLRIYSLQGKESAAKLAKEYGVCRGNIHNIWTGRSWRSVTNG
jgi:hypothetical protein